MAGREDKLAMAWSRIEEGILMDPPTPMGLFLGAEHDMFTMKHPTQKDKIIRGMSYIVMD